MKKIKKMNIIDKLYQEFVISKIKETDWSKGTDGPLIVELDTTEACDLACPGCVSEELIVARRRFSDERLMELGKELKEIGVKGVVLIGGGEPLAHPKIAEFMTYLGERDIHIGITTNGSFIGQYLEIIANYSSWTRVSVDAATDSLFRILRPTKGGGSKFNLIIENMRRLAKVKKGKLGFSFLIRTEADAEGIVANVHEIYDAARLARDIGCDYFEVKPSYQYRNNTVHTLVRHDLSKMEEAKKQIERLEELVTDGFEIIKAITLDASLAGAQYDQPKSYKLCPATELRTLITPSGVYVCPYWRGKDQFRVGDAMKRSMSYIWHSHERKKVMEWLDASVVCPFHCLRHESNLEVYKIIEDIKQGKNIKIIPEFDRFI